MSARDRTKSIAMSWLPEPARAWLRRRHRSRMLSATIPASRCFGLDRGGRPIDRYYIEGFLASHARDVHGAVVEIGDNAYTCALGGANVQRSDVLHVTPGNSRATIVGDLVSGHNLPSDTFDCVICTQTLMFVHSVPSSIMNIHRMLRDGGVALVTMAGISQICRYDMDHWGDYWRFTSLASQRLFDDVFGAGNVHVQSFGNPLAAVSLLQGLTVEELSPHELNQPDRDYEVLIAVRAVKRPRGAPGEA
jgi:hypothetical protein